MRHAFPRRGSVVRLVKEIDPGHEFELAYLDTDKEKTLAQVGRLRFVKRVGPKYPGNVDAHAGTTIQEVTRALIKRLIHLDGQDPHRRNKIALRDFRNAMRQLELRAAERAGDPDRLLSLSGKMEIEEHPACPTCGHIGCREQHA